jgi:hypothetical protein
MFLRRIALCIVLVLLCTGQASAATTGSNTWTSGGPYGGHVSDLAIDPMTPATIYAATSDSGLFESTNGGGNWIPMNITGLSNLSISVLKIDPSVYGLIYAGTGGGVYAFQQVQDKHFYLPAVKR